MAVGTVQLILNGTTHNLSLNSNTGKYEGTITAPQKSSYSQSGHYYAMTVKATDDAGNITTVDSTDLVLGNSLKLQVKETTAPVITITSPTESQKITNNKPTIQWKVTDNDSGVNPDTIGVIIDSGNKITSNITKTAITGGYQCSYVISSALSDGMHTIKIDASDYDGNSATQRSVSFTVDTVPPELSITSPTNNLITNNSLLTVAGTTNDATTSPVTLTIKVNNGSEEFVSVGSNGAFSKEVTLVSGTNTIVVTSTDSAGKVSTVTRTVTLDSGAPVIESISILPNPANVGDIITISVSVTD